MPTSAVLSAGWRPFSIACGPEAYCPLPHTNISTATPVTPFVHHCAIMNESDRTGRLTCLVYCAAAKRLSTYTRHNQQTKEPLWSFPFPRSMKGRKANGTRQSSTAGCEKSERAPENGIADRQTRPREAPDAAAAVALAQAKLEQWPTADHVIVPICPSGVKQREVAALTGALGLHCARMGTGASRWLLVSPRPLRLLFRDLSPDTRAHLQRYVGVRLFAIGSSHGRDKDSSDDGDHDNNSREEADDQGVCVRERNDRYVTLPHVDGAGLLAAVTMAIVTLGGEKRLVDLHRGTVARVTALLTSSPAFATWSSLPLPPMPCVAAVWPVRGAKPQAPTSKTATIYQMANDGSCFVSIDIIAANFQPLRHAGLIAEASWEAFVVRDDVLPDKGAIAYVARAKGLRMLALSQDALRPDLQRVLWSRVAVQAFERLADAGACAPTDLAAWNSDEIIIHADNAADAAAKVAQFAEVLADAAWADALACKAFILSTIDNGNGGVGFRRACLTTGRVGYKCLAPDRLAAVLFGDGSTISPVRTPCAVAVDGVFGAEARACDDVLSWLLFDPSARKHGATVDEIATRIVARGIPTARATTLALYVVDHRAASLVCTVPGHDSDNDKRVRCAWANDTETTAAYRQRAWPAIGSDGRDGPQCALLPNGVCLIDTLDACRHASRLLARQPVIAVDCEGISEGEIALVQIHVPSNGATGGDATTYFFDMLAPEARGGDAFFGAGGLGAVLASRCVAKVMHDARGDVAALTRRYGCTVRGLFDTQIAHALVLGGADASPKTFMAGLNEVLAAYAQPIATTTNKDRAKSRTTARSTRGHRARGGEDNGADDPTNADKKAVSRIMTRNRLCWHERPPTRRLLRYAAADVVHLVDAYRGLMLALDDACRIKVMILSDERAATAATRPLVSSLNKC
ncbi:DnaQ like exonuclease domain containing protein [Pandoravirus celtis]|uniref:DnaQ like exonuclease domain containing protein n=1 Tax=Pandoravirus celtis TaxID=2568002 RepID=A0A4D6EGM4_9VIRU|nr:DnaQ like exonuclease domain containing protein [Pandoravirus celtis]